MLFPSFVEDTKEDFNVGKRERRSGIRTKIGTKNGTKIRTKDEIGIGLITVTDSKTETTT